MGVLFRVKFVFRISHFYLLTITTIALYVVILCVTENSLREAVQFSGAEPDVSLETAAPPPGKGFPLTSKRCIWGGARLPDLPLPQQSGVVRHPRPGAGQGLGRGHRAAASPVRLEPAGQSAGHRVQRNGQSPLAIAPAHRSLLLAAAQ